MAVAPTADALGATLRERGMRVTPQRRDVLAAVYRVGHATAEQVAAQVPGVDLTTVYRTLQLLEDLGLLAHTHLGHGAPSYRAADDAHVHVICHDCGSVLDAPPDLADNLAQRLRTERGFTLDVAHFTVFGRCADCTATSATAPVHDSTAGPEAEREPRHEHDHGAGADHTHGRAGDGHTGDHVNLTTDPPAGPDRRGGEHRHRTDA